MNLTQLVLHFSDFSVSFYAIYKNQPTLKYRFRTVLQQGPWKFLFSYRNALALRISPREQGGPRNAAPGVRGEGGGRLKAHLGVDFRARRG
jgi:hypothetical protein